MNISVVLLAILPLVWICLLLVLIKGKLVLLLEKRNETKVHWQSYFLLSLSLQVILKRSRAFILKTTTNLPFIKTKRSHMHRYFHIVMSFQRVVHLEKKCFTARTFRTICGKQRRLKESVLVFLKLNYWGLILLIYFPYKDSVGHSSDWFMFLDKSRVSEWDWLLCATCNDFSYICDGI